MDINQAFGTALKQARKAKNLTQEDFAEISSRSYMSDMERGKNSVTLTKLVSLADRIDLHPITILTMAYLKKDKKMSLDKLEKLIKDEVVAILRP